MKSETLSFFIQGDNFTNMVRSIWADERAPGKALGIMEDCFPDLAEADRYAILCGDKKLDGDSREGLRLLPDNVKRSKYGNSLFAKDVFLKVMKVTKVTKSIDEKPENCKHDNYISQRNGWLSPDGKFHCCDFQQHIALSDSLGTTCRQLEKLGWIKLTSGEALMAEKEASQTQIDLVYDWYLKEKKEFPTWLKDILEEGDD